MTGKQVSQCSQLLNFEWYCAYWCEFNTISLRFSFSPFCLAFFSCTFLHLPKPKKHSHESDFVGKKKKCLECLQFLKLCRRVLPLLWRCPPPLWSFCHQIWSVRATALLRIMGRQRLVVTVDSSSHGSALPRLGSSGKLWSRHMYSGILWKKTKLRDYFATT